MKFENDKLKELYEEWQDEEFKEAINLEVPKMLVGPWQLAISDPDYSKFLMRMEDAIVARVKDCIPQAQVQFDRELKKVIICLHGSLYMELDGKEEPTAPVINEQSDAEVIANVDRVFDSFMKS